MPTANTREDLRQLRVDQVGGLCAPSHLRQVFAQYKTGKASQQELDRAKDEAIRHVIAKQESIGFPILTDGELRRRNFQESFSESVAGFDVAAEDKSMEGVSETPLVRAEQNFSAPGSAIKTRRRVVERLRLVRNVPLQEFSSRIAKSPLKVTVLSPDRISQRFDWQRSTSIYADMDAFWPMSSRSRGRSSASSWRRAAVTFRSMRRATPPTPTRFHSNGCARAARILSGTWRAPSPPTTR